MHTVVCRFDEAPVSGEIATIAAIAIVAAVDVTGETSVVCFNSTPWAPMVDTAKIVGAVGAVGAVLASRPSCRGRREGARAVASTNEAGGNEIKIEIAAPPTLATKGAAATDTFVVLGVAAEPKRACVVERG